MKVAELIAELQKLDPGATVIAPFSPNPMEINVEEVGGVSRRNREPYQGAVQLLRMDEGRAQSLKASVRADRKSHAGSEAVSDEQRKIIRDADSDAPV